MNTTRLTTVAAAATITLLALGGTALAIGGGDDPVPLPAPTAVSAPTSTPTTPAVAAPPALAAVSREDAVALAVARAGGGQVTGIEQEVEHGRTEWKVRVSRADAQHEIRVDVASGTVTRHDVDRIVRSRPQPRLEPQPQRQAPRDDHGGERRHGADDGPGHDVDDDHGGRSGSGHG